MKNHNNLGILDTAVPIQLRSVPVSIAFCWAVPVHLGSVPVPFGFCWEGVPVQPCFGIGTASGILPLNVSFVTFGTNSLHITSPFLNTSKINMEFIQNHSITLVLVVWNLIPQNPR